jgi:hypothetical protein
MINLIFWARHNKQKALQSDGKIYESFLIQQTENDNIRRENVPLHTKRKSFHRWEKLSSRIN